MRFIHIALFLLLCGCSQNESSIHIPDWSGTFECEEVGPKEILCYGSTVDGVPLQHMFVGNKAGVESPYFRAFKQKVRSRGGTVTILDGQ